MKNSIFTIAFVLFAILSFGQLKGSGKTVSKTFNYSNFDKITFADIDGTIEVEIGKPFSISITIDDNLESLLAFAEDNSNQSLKIYFKGNRNNNMYIEDTNIKIKVCMPTIAFLKHSGNSLLTVTNVDSKSLKVENSGNATTKISGKTTEFEATNNGNGNLYAENLVAEIANIKSTGNGNAKVNVSKTITARASGNGNVVNQGGAKFDSNSKQSGNGSLISK
jgi:hypothetical protein